MPSYWNPATGLYEPFVPGLPGNTPFAARQYEEEYFKKNPALTPIRPTSG